ncbi:DUF4157 domain-containing protein [Coleofasciculus sp. FACHB-129]|uniref:eCIS core domain-containing protein n=1 Tax=Cyanophyceae TaxID=3028117 RepID=UPI001686389B|nr:DUF4157 domain-containing protein [Coleofasciculus sp. FACHB-129]MBD1897942.1 DUF4157 domain-containing protein [Coleofasciculus sp. FACHB-129]
MAIQTKSVSGAPPEEQEMPSYKPLPADGVANHPLMRSLSEAQVVQRQEESGEEMEPIQAKLTIGEVGDKYEQEADQTAQQVVSQINSPQGQSLQREEMPEEEELQMKPQQGTIQREEMPEEEELQMKPTSGTIQREEMPEDEELQMKPMVQRQSDGGGMDATPDLEASIQQAKGGGQPLSDNIKEPMEKAFGADFSGVNVHTDAQSDRMNQSIQAKAFTTGQDVFFRQGAYDPGSRGGQELLAHELTHVVQQSGGKVQRKTNHKLPSIQTQPADIQCTPGEITGVDWSAATKAVPSSGGGMGGVMIVTIGGTDYILKAINSGAATLFGEKVLGEIGGAQTTKSQLIPNNGKGEGADIHTMLKTYMTRESDKKRRERWDNNYPFFEKAKYIALQKNMKIGGGEEMEEIIHSKAVLKILHPTLLYNLGKAMAADTLVGNADRFEEMNSGNAFVLARNKIGAIDTTTILQNYAEFIKEANTIPELENLCKGIETNAPKAWVQFITQSGLELGAKAPSSNLRKLLAGFDKWFQGSFKGPLIFKIMEYLDKSAVPSDEQWNLAKNKIKKGFEKGMDEVDKALSDQGYKQLKSGFKNLEKEYGEDKNYDWRAFKARRAYIVTLREGGTPEEAEQNAINVAEYMFVWKPKIKSITNIEPQLLEVSEKPEELKPLEKLGRKIKGFGDLNRSETDKQSKEIKKKARQGKVKNEDLEKVQGGAHRRDKKALFEVKFALFLASMEKRTAGFKDLREEHLQMKKLAEGKGPQAELAKKKVEFVKALYFCPELGEMLETYKAIGNEWKEILNDKNDKSKVKQLDQKLGELIENVLG